MTEAKMSLIVPETQRLRTPIVKNSRTAIPSAKSLFIHATLTNSEGVLCTEATCDYFTFTKEKSMRDMHFRECRAEGE